MQDRIRWEAGAPRQAVGLRSKIDVRVDLSPEQPGERSVYEEALRLLFPGGYTRQQAAWFIREAAKAVSRAVIRDRAGFFPMSVELLWEETRPQAALANIVPVHFRHDQPLA